VFALETSEKASAGKQDSKRTDALLEIFREKLAEINKAV
jgi:hypothetical protein